MKVREHSVGEMLIGQVYHAIMTLPQKDSRVKLAAARNTLESVWRPPKAP